MDEMRINRLDAIVENLTDELTITIAEHLSSKKSSDSLEDKLSEQDILESGYENRLFEIEEIVKRLEDKIIDLKMMYCNK